MKVSLFLQDGIQRNDGTIVVNVKGVLPPGVAVPGTTRTYGADGREKRTHAFAHPLAAELTLSPPMEQRVCELGGNLYSKERTLPAAETQTSMPLPSTLLPPPAVPPPPVPDSTEKANGILVRAHARARAASDGRAGLARARARVQRVVRLARLAATLCRALPGRHCGRRASGQARQRAS